VAKEIEPVFGNMHTPQVNKYRNYDQIIIVHFVNTYVRGAQPF